MKKIQLAVRWTLSFGLCAGIVVFPWPIAKWFVAFSFFLTIIACELTSALMGKVLDALKES